MAAWGSSTASRNRSSIEVALEDDPFRWPCRRGRGGSDSRPRRGPSRLQHPGIVQVFEVGEHQGNAFMALELCEGGSLDQRLRDQQADGEGSGPDGA